MDLIKKITFKKESEINFNSVFKERVDAYFTEKNLDYGANNSMYFKSITLFGIFSVSYLMLLLNIWNGWWFLASFSIMGFMVAVASINIAHDGLHRSYLSSPVGNRILGFFMDMCGKSSFFWGKEHTVDHHTYTNIPGHDKDLQLSNSVIRLCPNANYHFFHRYQNWYAPLLYGLHPLTWTYTEFVDACHIIIQRRAAGKKLPIFELSSLVFFKLLYIILFFVIPKEVTSLTWMQIILGNFCSLFTTGLVLAAIFQMAHIVENISFPTPNEEGQMENNYIRHQLNTTSNFATNSKFIAYLFGGLNFQIEHHLFPYLSHIHLYNIAPIVKATAKELGLPYKEYPTYWAALKSHFRMLKKLGKKI